MNKRKSSFLLTSIFIIFSMTVAFGTWDKGHSILNLGSDRSGGTTYFGEIKEYAVGDKALEVGSIKELEVIWKKGGVRIEEYDGDKILISEESETLLSEDYKMCYLSKNGKLIIRYSKYMNGENEELKLNKDLTILIPNKNRSLINEIKLNTVNSKINVSTEYISKLKFDSINGNTDVLGRYNQIEMKKTSGDIYLELLNCPKLIDSNIVNGDITLSIPENKGFSIETEMKKGELESDFPLIAKENYAIYKKAKSKINISIVNGDIRLLKQK